MKQTTVYGHDVPAVRVTPLAAGLFAGAISVICLPVFVVIDLLL